MAHRASSRPEHGVVVALDLMVPMRDGVRLATDVYLPAAGGSALPGPFPTLLIRTPYDKRGQETAVKMGEYFARRGYVVAIQDCRGRYRSEGSFTFLVQEPEDGYDTVAWLTQQPWCNGKVGTLGTSYLAWVQNALACLNPPGLAAMYVNQGGASAYHSSVRHNGAFELRFMAWAFMGAATSPEAMADPTIQAALTSTRFRDWLARLPLRPGLSPLSLVPAYERWMFDIWTRGDYDEYWEQPGFNFLAHVDRHADVPMLFCGGWYDSYTRSTLENFVAFSRRKRGPVRAIVGPWTHGTETPDLTYAGDIELGPAASIAGNLAEDVYDHHLRFFDWWLKGLDTGMAEEPPLRIFVMGGGDGHRTPQGRLYHGGAWREEREWPLARAIETPFYLQPGGGLAPRPPEADEASTSFRFDPADPVPTVGGNISSLADFYPVPPEIAARVRLEERWASIVAVGGQNQRTSAAIFGARPPYLPLASRPDVLVFQTEPLAEPVEVTGPITAVLWVSSSAPDTDITVKLVDVYPPNPDYPEGYALNLSDSIFRLRYHAGWDRPQALEPGQIYRIEIPMYPTSNLFGAGHRIRVDISSSNFPRFDVNPNTGEPLGRHTRTQVAINTIHHDRAHPSHLLLPLVPR
uniref:CocE/NonD family hydrolase n=1 Tax=Thermorudis sp. TaxID=1969470 RepID=A0A7C2WH83_9BACT